MTVIIIGNIIALTASLLMVYSGLLKKAKDVVYIQSIQIALFVVSNLVLGGISGAISNLLSLIRNIVFYKNKLTLPIKIILSIISIVLILSLNTQGLLGFLPLIYAIVYLWFIDIKDPIKFKYLNIFSVFLWLVYDICILSFTSAIFDFGTIITNIIAVFKLHSSKSTKNNLK